MYVIKDASGKILIKTSVNIPDSEHVDDDFEQPYNPDDAINNKIAIIDSQIAAIEAKTYRPLREIQLGIDSGGAALGKLNEYNMQIEELRTKRAKL